MSASAFDGVAIGRAAAMGGSLAWLEHAGIDTVHLGLFDASGTLRQKRVGVAAAVRAFEQGWSFIDAIQWWGPTDEVWRSGGSEHQRVEVDTGSGRPYPFEPSAALFLAEFTGPLAQLSPRHQLQRMVDRLANSGLQADMAWEFECIVLEDADAGSGLDGDQVRPAIPSNYCWSAQTLASESKSIAGLARTLADGAVPVDHVCAELGPGCLEVAFAPQPALLAADNAALGKIFTKAYFCERGQTATFMAQLGAGYPGLGGHPSLSLRSTLDGSPALAEDDGALSKLARAAIAGVVALLPDFLAMVAPNPNSYRRFGPGNWAPSTATWGIGNYSCALRVVADAPESTRLELRIPGADTSPHLCAAMFLGAALWGIEHGLDPPPPVPAPADGREHASGGPLPHDLVEAVGRFVESDTARALFGPTFVDHYAASRLAEERACRRFVSREERLRYMHYV